MSLSVCQAPLVHFAHHTLLPCSAGNVRFVRQFPFAHNQPPTSSRFPNFLEVQCKTSDASDLLNFSQTPNQHHLNPKPWAGASERNPCVEVEAQFSRVTQNGARAPPQDGVRLRFSGSGAGAAEVATPPQGRHPWPAVSPLPHRGAGGRFFFFFFSPFSFCFFFLRVRAGALGAGCFFRRAQGAVVVAGIFCKAAGQGSV